MCGEKEVTETEAYKEYQDTKSFEGDAVTCFCLQEFKSMLDEVSNYAFPDKSRPCKVWLEDFQLTNLLSQVISLALSAINATLRVVIKTSTKFEGHHSITDQLSSSFSKMWIIQFVNTAVILVMINNSLSDGGFIRKALNATGTSSLVFNGKYSDFSQQWYSVVGITLLTTCFINGVSPIVNLGFWGLACCKRFLDRGCTNDSKKTRKILQEDYEATYTGKEIQYDNRFSVLIAMIWVIMMFSCAMPSLYLAGIVLCVSMYWTDKILLLRFYKIPPRHGSDLALKARNIIEWSLLVHLFMGLYMVSNPAIFTSEEDDNKAVAFFQVYAKAVAVGISATTGVNADRFEQVHVVLYSAGISIFLILFLIEKISGTISGIMGKTCCHCLYRNS